MISRIRCLTCVYWEAPEVGEYGVCFRFPPKAHITDDGGDTVQQDVRPRPAGTEWCGEWRERVAEKKSARH